MSARVPQPCVTDFRNSQKPARYLIDSIKWPWSWCFRNFYSARASAQRYGFQKFSKISSLLNWLCRMTVELTFEKYPLKECLSQALWISEILKSQRAAQLAVSRDCRCTATHCNTLQHTATHCNALQHIATHCHTLPHTATHCNALQHATTTAVAQSAVWNDYESLHTSKK